jgi:predicted nucleic acid-binding Zn ribbon protein
MVEKIGQHTHCHICGKAIPFSDSETLCSDECKQKYQGMLKKRKWLVYIMYAAVIFMVVMLVYTSFQRPA